MPSVPKSNTLDGDQTVLEFENQPSLLSEKFSVCTLDDSILCVLDSAHTIIDTKSFLTIRSLMLSSIEHGNSVLISSKSDIGNNTINTSLNSETFPKTLPICPIAEGTSSFPSGYAPFLKCSDETYAKRITSDFIKISNDHTNFHCAFPYKFVYLLSTVTSLILNIFLYEWRTLTKFKQQPLYSDTERYTYTESDTKNIHPVKKTNLIESCVDLNFFRFLPTPHIIVNPVHSETKEKNIDSLFAAASRDPSILTSKDSMNYEWLRLLSFQIWPRTAQSLPLKLAQAGFYYSGNADEVICYSCGGHVKNWTTAMVPMEVHTRFFPQCPFIQKTCSNNVSIKPKTTSINVPNAVNDRQTIVSNFTTNSTEVGVHSSYSAVYSPMVSNNNFGQVKTSTTNAIQSLASASNIFFPNMEVGNTRVISDGPSDVTSPSPLATQNQPARTVPDLFTYMEDTANRTKSFENWKHEEIVTADDLVRAGLFYQGVSDRVQCAWCKGVLHKWKDGDDPLSEHRKFYPYCSFIRNLALNEATARGEEADQMMGVMSKAPKHPNYATVASREKSFLGWPSQLEQTPNTLAEAGFFYVGFGDCVKCFMCNGGLRNWAVTDVPWEEHAQWFPECEYVRMHGKIATPQTVSFDEVHGDVIAKDDASSSVPGNTVLTNQSDITVRVSEMGYSETNIEKALKIYEDTHNNFSKLSVQSLLDILLQIEESEDVSVPKEPILLEQTAVVSNPISNLGKPEIVEESTNLDPKSLLAENRSLKETLKEKNLCKICMENPLSIVFLPCGHLVTCATCAPALKTCPICRAKVKGRVKTFLS